MSSDTQPTGQFRDLSERTCAYYQNCTGAAIYAVPVERVGDGEREVLACQDCAFEHVDGLGRSMDDLRELDASERWQADRGQTDTATMIMLALAFIAATALAGVGIAHLVVGGMA